MQCLHCGKELNTGLGLCVECSHARDSASAPPETAEESARFSFSDMLLSPKVKFASGALILLIVLYTVKSLFGVASVSGRSFRLPPGVTVSETPLQEPTSKARWTYKGFNFVPKASYHIRARVVLAARHGRVMGDMDLLAPVDLSVVWGKLSDTALLKHYSFTHSYRIVFPASNNPPMSWKEFGPLFANMHVIPANAAARKTLLSLGTDDIVTLDGYLVNVYSEDGASWEGSLTRDDHGCEVMWVESAVIQ